MHTFRAMNTEFRTASLPPEAQREAESWFAWVERTLSRFDSASELSRLNAAGGAPFAASPLLYAAVSEADRRSRETGGLFDPLLGHILCGLGYDRSFEQLGEAAEEVPDSAASPLAALYRLHAGQAQRPRMVLDPRTRIVRLPPEAALDLGGIAKGWSAQQFAELLQSGGIAEGSIDAGGDIVVWGGPERAQEIGVADPLNPDRMLAVFELRGSAAVATSSSRKRSWQTGGQRRHHLLDPRTRLPGDSGLASVSVIAPTLTEAEVYAKCVLLLGPEEGPAWLERRRPGLTCLAAAEDGRLLAAGPLASSFDEAVDLSRSERSHRS